MQEVGYIFLGFTRLWCVFAGLELALKTGPQRIFLLTVEIVKSEVCQANSFQKDNNLETFKIINVYCMI